MIDNFRKDASLKRIYEKMEESRSKDIFSRRLLYSLTGDPAYRQAVGLMTESGRDFYKALKNSGREIIGFGTGFWADEIVSTFADIKWKAFTDNCLNEGANISFHGAPIISFTELKNNHKDALIVILTRVYENEIYDQLLKEGFPPEQIINAGALLNRMQEGQYFDLPELKPSKNEVFVDGGSCDGDTARSFIKWCGGDKNNYRVLAFEPDMRKFQECEEMFRLECIRGKVYRAGLWNQSREISFQENKSGLSDISEDGDKKIQVYDLDSIAKGETVTFIKLDVEGSELNAIRGAKNIISNQKPRMAISVYHKVTDIWEIPLLLLELNSGYRFFLRHYSLSALDTVLYAV